MTKKQYGDEAERLAPSLRRIAYSIVRNEHDAQDAVQQALLSVWARRENVDLARLKPYLARAVINACRDIQRARQKAIPVETVPEILVLVIVVVKFIGTAHDVTQDCS